MTKLFNRILGATGLVAFLSGYCMAQEVFSRSNNLSDPDETHISSRVNSAYVNTHELYQSCWSASLMIVGGATAIYSAHKSTQRNS
ncbi:MAG: hypothetical protein WCK90_00935 [archaeon]